MECPCGSREEYNNCCEPYVTGKRHAPTPEALMRSRYSAFTKHVEPYLKETLAPESRSDYDSKETREWSQQSDWLGLKILSAQENEVDFIARYRMKGKTFVHRERSTFRKQDDRWYFVTGDAKVEEDKESQDEPKIPLTREGPKIGRNDPCSCGSGKKFKKCCGTT